MLITVISYVGMDSVGSDGPPVSSDAGLEQLEAMGDVRRFDHLSPYFAAWAALT